MGALLVLRAAELLMVAFGIATVCYAARAYRKTKSRPMYLLTIGFAITTIGAVAGGITFELMGADFRERKRFTPWRGRQASSSSSSRSS